MSPSHTVQLARVSEASLSALLQLLFITVSPHLHVAPIHFSKRLKACVIQQLVSFSMDVSVGACMPSKAVNEVPWCSANPSCKMSAEGEDWKKNMLLTFHTLLWCLCHEHWVERNELKSLQWLFVSSTRKLYGHRCNNSTNTSGHCNFYSITLFIHIHPFLLTAA